jgi:hypothetical protein
VAQFCQVTTERAHRDTPGIFLPDKDETIKVRGLKGKWKFVQLEQDAGGDFAVIVGGLSGHRKRRYVTLDRLISMRPKRRRKRKVVDVELELRSDMGELEDEQRDV